MKFRFHVGRSLGYLKAAARAAEREDSPLMLRLLQFALRAGSAALRIQSPDIADEERAAATKVVTSTLLLYQREFIAKLPGEDRELVAAVLQSWASKGYVAVDADPIELMIGMFDIAKSRLDAGEKLLGLIYTGDHVPTPLRKIMQQFLAGEASREETERRLDTCAAKLRQWMPELFPEGLLDAP